MNNPAILVSYVFLNEFLRLRNRAEEGIGWYRSWALDSGAFSALSRGTVINLEQYTERALALLKEEKNLGAVFALDVIGDPEASARNAEYMNAHGVPAIPTFHHGSNWSYLTDLAARYPKIALGGLVARGEKGLGAKLGWKDRLAFLENSFSRVWPKWIHGFGCTDVRFLFKVPFAAVDSTSWFFRVRQYGRIQGYSNLPSPMVSKSRSGAEAGTRCSFQQFMELEEQVQSRLGKFVKTVSDEPFSLRLATMASDEELSFLSQEK